MTEAVNLAEKLASFDEAFQPRIVGYYNGNKIPGTPNTGDSTEREAAREEEI